MNAPKPATPLPFKLSVIGGALRLVEAHEPQFMERQILATFTRWQDQQHMEGARTEEAIALDARYVLTACNAYPQLVDALHRIAIETSKRMAKGGGLEHFQDGNREAGNVARALLRELGERS